MYISGVSLNSKTTCMEVILSNKRTNMLETQTLNSGIECFGDAKMLITAIVYAESKL